MRDAARALPAEPACSRYLGDEAATWAIRVDPFRRSYSPEEKKKMILDLNFLGFKGKVQVMEVLLVMLFPINCKLLCIP